MLEIVLYIILIIIVIIIIGVSVYYLNDYLENKRKVNNEFNATSDYINTNFNDVDNKFNITTDYINKNFNNINNTTSQINNNIRILDSNTHYVNNKVNRNTTLLDNKINITSSNIYNNMNTTRNDLNILNNNINYTHASVGNINSNLHDYFTFGNSPQTNNLLYNYVSKSVVPNLNILSSVMAASGLTIKTNPTIGDPNNLRVCDNNTQSPNCVNLNVNAGNFNITPETNNVRSLVMNNQTGSPVAAFNLNDNSIYLGIGANKDNSAMYIKDNNFYVKNINLVKDPAKQYSSVTSTDVVPFSFNKLSDIVTHINALETGIRFINILSGGSGYSSTPTITFTNASNDPGTGAMAQATLTNGVVTAINLISNGKLYGIAPTVVISPPDNLGKVIIINVNNGGYGYFSIPSITISGGGGNGATATATIQNGSISGIIVNIGGNGSGYTTPPSVNITGVAQGSLFSNGIAITGGSGYTVPPIVSFTDMSPGGTPAIATCTIVGGSVNSIIFTNNGSGYTTSSRVVFTRASDDTTGSGASGIITSVGSVASATAVIGTRATAQAILYNPIVLSSS